MHQFYVNSNA
jgi:hypothetical protein